MTDTFVAAAGNKAVYSTVEFHRWVGRVDLDDDEKYLLSHYLDPKKRTLEAGTAGGRILFALQQMGFTDLHGYDYVPGFIEQARAADASHAIQFEVQDATHLEYPDNAFDQIIYMQQLLCCMDGESATAAATREAVRILKPGGMALFSFLSFEIRRQSLIYGSLIQYLRALRWLRGSRRTLQALPWMRLGDRFNWRALLDYEPYVYWFRADEAERMLKAAGFDISAVATTKQVGRRALCKTAAELLSQPMHGALYFVCKKA